MLFEKAKLWILINLLLSVTLMQAQVSIPATGNNFTGNGGTINFTVGQIAYSTNNGTSGFVIQGVQQPYEISTVTCIDEAKVIGLYYSICPNPTTDYVVLKTENYKIEKLQYQLFDLKGTLLETRKIENVETNIDMTKYICTTYILKIIDDNKNVKVFKLLKNK